MTEYLASPFRERTRTHRSHPSELSSCSAARCSRSRSARRRSSRSDSDNRRRDFVAMMAPSEGPARCGPMPPKRTPKGCKNQAAGPQRPGTTPEQPTPGVTALPCATPRGRRGLLVPRRPKRTETSVRRESWSLLRPTRRVGAPPLECTNSGHVGGADLVAAFVRKQSRCGEARASTGWLLCCAGDSVPARWVANFRILGREQ